MKKAILIGLLVYYHTCSFAQELNTLYPSLSRVIVIDQHLADNFNSEESLDKCLTVWTKMEKEHIRYEDLSAAEKEILRYCGEVQETVWDVPIGCGFYCSVEEIRETASSHLAPQGAHNYYATNAHDLNYQTAWVEGSGTGGLGEFLEYAFDKEDLWLNQVIVVNGYVKSQDAWRNNSRVKKLKLSINDLPVAILSLEDARSEQSFDIEEVWANPAIKKYDSKPFWKMRFEILEVYPGERFAEVAITEIYFEGGGH